MKSASLLLTGLILFLLPVQTVFGFDHSYEGYNNFLKEDLLVMGPQSRVRYDNIQKDPSQLEAFVQEVESVTKSEFDTWSRNQQIAFLVNAYNALTIKLILTKYPNLKSIKDLGGFFSGPWKVEFFTLFGKPQYLDYIEHGMLRKDYNEPRVHFALVCASISCPPLRQEAYRPDILDRQLNSAMQTFLRDPERNRFDRSNNTLYLSSIFKWFEEDFLKHAVSVKAFVAPGMTDDPNLQELIESDQIKVEYLDYDWSLNKAG